MKPLVYQKSLHLRIAKLQSKYDGIRTKQESAITKPTAKKMKAWLETNQELQKVEKQLRNTKRLLSRAQGLHKVETSN